jgi:hypothetical protein
MSLYFNKNSHSLSLSLSLKRYSAQQAAASATSYTPAVPKDFSVCTAPGRQVVSVKSKAFIFMCVHST